MIGNANYDVGHVFTTGPAARRRSASSADPAPRPVAPPGRRRPVNDPFVVDFVAHEVGHEFGGNHTVQRPPREMRGNRNAGTTYEPGSGRRCGHAGICRLDNLQRVGGGTGGGRGLRSVLPLRELRRDHRLHDRWRPRRHRCGPDRQQRPQRAGPTAPSPPRLLPAAGRGTDADPDAPRRSTGSSATSVRSGRSTTRRSPPGPCSVRSPRPRRRSATSRGSPPSRPRTRTSRARARR